MKLLPILNPLKSQASLSMTAIIIAASIFLLALGNIAFFRNLTSVYPLDWHNAAFLLSLTVFFAAANILLLSLAGFRYTLKPLLILVFMLSSFAAYFMDAYNTVIDHNMIRNIMNTDVDETLDLFSVRLVVYVLILGVLPSWVIYRCRLQTRTLIREVISRILLMVTAILVMAAAIFAFSDYYSSFFREHKQLRFYSNPGFYIYSVGKFLHESLGAAQTRLVSIGEDAGISAADNDRELIIFVVGEAARADHFSLNGYGRDTNPMLRNKEVISFDNFWSCGTSTNISVPCMFSILDEDSFSNSAAASTENVLDVLQRSGVNVLWLDNNSSSKGVADRVPNKSFKRNDVNHSCDSECRDIGMLEEVNAYIQSHDKGDILIVLHQMGNHGPAYYKRYPPAFEKFTPVCTTNQLEDCSKQELVNAYDNAILYTDYFLANVIDLLKQYDESFETAMFYVSDHGESLGENGLYLHGLPNMLAPDAQRRVPAVLWVGKHYDEIDTVTLKTKRSHRFTHDNIFHTLLGLMEVNSSIYQPAMDIVRR